MEQRLQHRLRGNPARAEPEMHQRAAQQQQAQQYQRQPGPGLSALQQQR